jgi:[ribosomal protein S5]-alanine N-acetyltransferase
MKKKPNLTNPHAREFYDTVIDNYKRQAKDIPHMPPARKPRFDYQDLPNSLRLKYELMTWDNFTQISDLFQNDPNPFVSEEFKTLERVEFYAVSQLEYNFYSFKRGACDWYIKLKDTNELVGILHIYDLNWELYDGEHPACVIGYAIGEQFRRKGYATEAVQQLLHHIPLIFKRYKVMANPQTKNIPSRRLLENLGFAEDSELDSDDTWWEKVLVENVPLKTSDQVWEEEQKYR